MNTSRSTPVFKLRPTRRDWLLRSGAWVAAGLLPVPMAQAALHGNMGAVQTPFVLPDVKVLRENGRPVRLNALLEDRITALQLVFTGCSDTCPMQGAIFGQLLPLLPMGDAAKEPDKTPPWQLLSLSIDPLGDTPSGLKVWRERWSADPRWQSLLPSHEVLDQLLPALKGRILGRQPHTTQVFLFDRQARLAMRTVDLPSAPRLAGLMQQLATQASTP